MQCHILGNLSVPVQSISAPAPTPKSSQVSLNGDPSQILHPSVIVNDPNHVMPKAKRLILSAIHKSGCNVSGANCIHLRQIEVYDKDGINWASFRNGAIAGQTSNHFSTKGFADSLIDEDYASVNSKKVDMSKHKPIVKKRW